jgi:DNA-directed RNA polymerase subunit RPC12/RpoP
LSPPTKSRLPNKEEQEYLSNLLRKHKDINLHRDIDKKANLREAFGEDVKCLECGTFLVKSGLYYVCPSCGLEERFLKGSDVSELKPEGQPRAPIQKMPRQCLDCGAIIPYLLKGRPPLRCDKCSEARTRHKHRVADKMYKRRVRGHKIGV